MQGLEKDTIGGFNGMIEKQKNVEGEALISTVLFDHESVVLHDRINIREIRPMTDKDYTVRGCTALLDAIGGAIHHIGNIHKYARNEDVPEKTVFVIITDGMENSSREYSGAAVCENVKRLRAKGWTFVYIGANHDAVEVARRMSIDNAMNFQATHEDTRRMWKDYRESTSGYYEKVRMSKMRGERVFEDKEFFAKGPESSRMTPDRITSLNPGEIFVFGSNVDGFHNGGAAGFACRHFGAVYGNPEGPQGQCYAIPTVGLTMRRLHIKIQEFIDYAESHPNLTFLVTAIGCGNGGCHPEDIAPMFDRARNVDNIHLPSEFWRYI
jgi:uncharacterized protein YegL